VLAAGARHTVMLSLDVRRPASPRLGFCARRRYNRRALKIVVRDLTKVFESGKATTHALAGVSLEVADGEFLCIVGPSGCGKTTLLRIMAGLEVPSTGAVEMRRTATDARPLNSMVFQEHSLFPWLTILDNVAFGLEMRGIARRERIARARAFLDTVGLGRFRDHYPHQLSGGMKQRASLARAFVNDPQVLLMDEPFASLDAQNKVLLQEELLRIWERNRKTVVYITHSIDEALLLGDRVVVMTAVPGRIKDILDVKFERPRDVIETKATPRFAELAVHIWRVLESEVRQARLA
jgi:NitT/TauT family transport system ATP-binding protein